MKTKKYEYLKVIQQNYGFGWEDVSQYDANGSGLAVNKEVREAIKHDLGEYRLMGYPTRVIFRKTKLTTVNA